LKPSVGIFLVRSRRERCHTLDRRAIGLRSYITGRPGGAGTTSAAYGQGTYHTDAYGYGTAYHPPDYYYGYHPPTTVNYYGATCAAVHPWATTAAIATTAAVTGAAVANANAANANAAATSSNAYNAGYNAGATTATTAVVAAPVAYSMGQIVAALPAGCITPTVQGTTYYLCGNNWFAPASGANGVYYKVVAAA